MGYYLRVFLAANANLDPSSVCVKTPHNVSVIATLKSKLYQETQKNQHFTKVFNELNERLADLEQAEEQPEKQKGLQKLQGWVHSKRVLH